MKKEFYYSKLRFKGIYYLHSHLHFQFKDNKFKRIALPSILGLIYALK